MSLSRLLRLLGALLLLATVTLVGRLATTEWQSLRLLATSRQAVEQLGVALRAAEMVSRERGPTNGALGDISPPALARQQALAQARVRTDAAFDALQQVLPLAASGPARANAAQQVQAARLALVQARGAVDRVIGAPKDSRTPEMIRGAVYGMVAVVPMLAPVASLLTNEAQQAYPALSGAVQSARLSAELREYAGLLGSHFTAALAQQQPFQKAERAVIEQTRGRIAELRFLLELQVQGQSAEVAQAWRRVDTGYFQHAGQLLEKVIAAGESEGRYGLDPAGFAALYVPDMDTVVALRDVLLAQAGAQVAAEHARALRMLVTVMAGALALLAVLAGALFMIHRRILRPLVETTRALKALADQQLDAPLPQPSADDEMAAVIGAVRALQVQTRERQALECERDDLIAQLRAQSDTDFLTQLPNRRAFLAAAEGVLAQAQRLGFGVVVVMLDVDRFKRLNDSLGHAAGDRALRAVADAVRSELRLGDLVARLGGEEFVVLLSHCDRVQGLSLAERLREVIAGAPLACPSGEWAQITASLGVADSEQHGLVLERLLSKADAAMYRAKQAGRNQVVIAAAEYAAA